MSEEWLTSEQAATLLSCTAETIRSMLRDKLLPPGPPGLPFGAGARWNWLATTSASCP